MKILEKKVTKYWLVAIIAAGILVSSVIAGASISSNSINVPVTQKTLVGIALTVNNTAAITFSGPTSPGDTLIIKATTNPAIIGYLIGFYSNTTLLSSGLTDSSGNIQGIFTVPALKNPPNGDYYVFTAQQMP